MGEFGLDATMVYGAVGVDIGAQARAATSWTALSVGLPTNGEANELVIDNSVTKRRVVANMLNSGGNDVVKISTTELAVEVDEF